MTKLACETCPFWEDHKSTTKGVGICHYAEAGPSGIVTYINFDHWCRHHPDAPKVVTVTVYDYHLNGEGLAYTETHTEIREASDE